MVTTMYSNDVAALRRRVAAGWDQQVFATFALVRSQRTDICNCGCHASTIWPRGAALSNSANRKHQITRHPWRDFTTTTPELSCRYTQGIDERQVSLDSPRQPADGSSKIE